MNNTKEKIIKIWTCVVWTASNYSNSKPQYRGAERDRLAEAERDNREGHFIGGANGT